MTDFNSGGILYKTPGIELGGICRTAGDPDEPIIEEPGRSTMIPPLEPITTGRTVIRPTTTPGWGSNFGQTTPPPTILRPVNVQSIRSPGHQIKYLSVNSNSS